MNKVKEALEYFRKAFMTDFPANSEYELRRDEILNTMSPEEKEIYDLAVAWYYHGQRDGFERIVE